MRVLPMHPLAMVPLVAIPVVVLCAALAVPATAPAGSWIGPPPAPAIPAPRPGGIVKGRPDRDSYFGDRPARRDRRHRPRHRPPRPALPYGYYYDYDDDYDRDETVVVPPPAPPPAPVPLASPVDQPPPDPRGRSRFVPARGVAAEPSAYTIGEPLPPGVPHVTLDWAYYRLPEPPPGRIYARVGRDVLLIEAASRVVVGRIEREQTGSPGADPGG